MLGRRLAVVVAGPGYGKTALLRAWSETAPVVRHALVPADRALGAFARHVVDALRLRVPGIPEHVVAAVTGGQGPGSRSDEAASGRAYAELLASALDESLLRDIVLVLDDVQEIDEAPGPAALIAGLVRQAPARFHVVLASRRELPFGIARLRGQGELVELTGPELAFTTTETAALLGNLLDSSPDLAVRLQEVTAGWPAALRLAIEGLRRTPADARLDAVGRMPRRGEPLFRYLVEEALEAEPPAVRDLLGRFAPFEVVHEGLGAVVGIEGASELLTSITSRGVWAQELDGEPGWFMLTPLAHAALDDDLAPPAAATFLQAAAFFESHGRAVLALGAVRSAGDTKALASLLIRRGRDLLAAGHVPELVESLLELPPEDRTARLELLEAEARQVQGDWEGALLCLRDDPAATGPLPAENAWRLGVIHHMRGELDAAEQAYGRGVLAGDDPANEALLLAWFGALSWLRGDAAGCRERAAAALLLAQTSGDPQALATAHTVAAMEAALRSDRAANDAHYLRALDYAEQARDVLLTIRIRTNRASRLLEEGFFEESIVELDNAIRLAEPAGYNLFRALALANRGQALRSLGRLDDAARDLELSRAQYERLGSRMISYPLAHLGDVHRLRGDFALARAAFEEAAAQAEPVGDLQGLVPALAGLARVVAPDDAPTACRLALQAVGLGPVLAHVTALLAAAEAHLAAGAHETADAYAARAAEVARSRRDRAGLAEALELLATTRPEQDTELLDDSHALWVALRDPIGECRTALALLRLRDDEKARWEAAGLERRFRSLGCRRLAAAAARAARSPTAPLPLAIHTLGGFAVRRDGEYLPASAWQSRKTRDVLKILVARRGTPVPRDQLMELLWPGEPPERASRRLSVTLSTLRATLDPGKRESADHVVVADATVCRLRLDHVDIDVESFLSIAERGLALLAQGDREVAVEALTAAEAAYLGDFLEEDVYSDWTAALRTRARDAYVRTVRALASIAAADGDPDGAARFLLRLLERDPYDEGAHLLLVTALTAAGRHGEARRAYHGYSQRMEELAVEAAPFPSRAIVESA